MLVNYSTSAEVRGMDLHTITEVKRPASPDEIQQWPQGHAWLAGGTWLFSEPQSDQYAGRSRGLAGPR